MASSDDLSKEMTGKAVMCRPAIASVILPGPVDLDLGLAASVAVVAPGGGSDSAPSNGERFWE
jgi:hypothetical protein